MHSYSVTCDGAALAVPGAVRSGGTASGGTGAAGNAEADGSTMVFACTHSNATATLTCEVGRFSDAVFSGDACPGHFSHLTAIVHPVK